MPRPRKPKVEKNATLPASIKDRELLDNILEEIVGYMQVQDTQKAYIKGAIETLTDSDGKLNLDPKYARRLIKAAYDKVKLSKLTKEQQEALDDYEVLKNKKSEE
jgi:hypothetical protein